MYFSDKLKDAGDYLSKKSHDVSQNLLDAEQATENKLRETSQSIGSAIDSKLQEAGSFLSGATSSLLKGLDDTSKSAHEGIDEGKDFASGIFSKGLIHHK